MLTPVLLRGGTEVQTLHLTRALRDAGYAVSVACYFESEPDVRRAFEDAGAEVRLLGLGRARDAARAGRLLAVGGAVRRILRELRPGVAHVQYIAPGLVPILAARAARTPVVLATLHRPADPHGWKARALLRLAARLCRCVLCVSRAVEAGWFGDSTELPAGGDPGGRRHVTLSNCVEADRFGGAAAALAGRALRAQLGLGPGPVVGFVGRLRQEKGADVLLAAMGRIAVELPEARLLLAGDGPGAGELHRRADATGLGERVAWLGSVEVGALPAVYAAADVVAVPSRFEGFGLVAAEAMASARPVVASRTGGLAEVVEDGETGLLVPVGDDAALAQALLALLRDPGRASAMGRCGRERVRARYAYEGFSERVAALYRGVARGPASAEAGR